MAGERTRSPLVPSPVPAGARRDRTS